MYFSAIETLTCRREISLIGSTSFGFAQNTIHNLQNTLLNSWWYCLRQMPKKLQYLFSGNRIITCSCSNSSFSGNNAVVVEIAVIVLLVLAVVIVIVINRGYFFFR